MSKYGVPASAAAAAASSRLEKRKLKVRFVESSEDSDVEDTIEQTGSVSLNELQHHLHLHLHLQKKMSRLITN
jgi:hypothetical protein